MIRTIVVSLTLMMGTALADFPTVDKLPAQPGLPDPLVMLDGTKVTSSAQWSTKRRPELQMLFEHYMYGNRPSFAGPAKTPDAVLITIIAENDQALGGKANLRELAIRFKNLDGLTMRLLVVTPKKVDGKVPVFVGANFYGNHTTLDDPAIALPTAWVPDKGASASHNRATDAGRGAQRDVWSIEANIDHGNAVATFYCGDIAPDHPGLGDGVFLKSGTARSPQDWGAVSAWAWGIERAVDYLVSDSRIDPSKIVVVGHSRLGKAAMLAGALDPRIAVVTAHQAGCGGTAPSRGKVGESIKQINDRFPHWFCDEFKTFNDQPERLPFDQNSLFAMVAPRPLLLTNATLDTWANPVGQFDALVAADGVYKLLGAGGLVTPTMPAVGTLSDGTLGYHIRPGTHAMTRDDWKVWWTYAEKHWGPSRR